jgi:tRNA(Ile)-lysidine synthase
VAADGQNGAGLVPAEAGLVAAIAPVLAAAPTGRVGVAVSGGGDSTALLLLAHAWARAEGRLVEAVTVDHGLREESRAEAEAVARRAAALGVRHALLAWDAGDGRGNLQARARAARRRLIADWARGRGIAAVALGHTLDDQAETVLQRLARGSGVDGLAAMAPVTEAEGILWLRPFLGLRRDALRAWLAAEGEAWAEDPGNADRRYQRVRAREALAALAPIGLTPERLAATAARMAGARVALEADTAALAAAACVADDGFGETGFDPAPLGRAPREIALRLMAEVLGWVAGAPYRPRLVRLAAALDAVIAGRVGAGLTLHGCVLRLRGGRVVVRREPARAGPPVPAAPGALWDGRWRLEAVPAGARMAVIAAAGEAALGAAAWRETGAARETLLATPALWQLGAVGRPEGLVQAPLIVAGGGWTFARTGTRRPPWVRPSLR